MKRGTFIHIQTIGGSGVKIPEERCPTTGKTMLLSEEHAVEVRAEFIHFHNSRPGNIYRCPYCLRWHITRQQPPIQGAA